MLTTSQLWRQHPICGDNIPVVETTFHLLETTSHMWRQHPICEVNIPAETVVFVPVYQLRLLCSSQLISWGVRPNSPSPVFVPDHQACSFQFSCFPNNDSDSFVSFVYKGPSSHQPAFLTFISPAGEYLFFYFKRLLWNYILHITRRWLLF